MKGATNLDNDSRYRDQKKQDRWIEFSKSVIAETAKKINGDSTLSLKDIYAALATKRRVIAEELGHGIYGNATPRTADYGLFREESETHTSKEIFRINDPNQTWKHQAPFAFGEFFGSTIKDAMLSKGSFIERIAYVESLADAFGIKTNTSIATALMDFENPSKLDEESRVELEGVALKTALSLFQTIKPKEVNLASLKTKEDLSDELLGKLLDAVLRDKEGRTIYPKEPLYNITIPSPVEKDGEDSHALSTFGFYPPTSAEPFHQLVVDYTSVTKEYSKSDWRIANHHFQDMSKAATPEEFSFHAGKMMYMMAHMLPVKLGNAGMMEWLVTAAANAKGYDFDFKREEGLGWDFKALFTVNQDEYAKWFQSKVICKSQTAAQDKLKEAPPTTTQSPLAKPAQQGGVEKTNT